MNKLSRDVTAVIVAVVSFLIGIGLLWVVKKWEIQDSNVAIVIILLVPLIFYLVVSEKVLEFSAPGGFQFKFAEATMIPLARITLSELRNLDLIQPVPLIIHKEFGEFEETELWQNPNVLKMYVEDLTEFSPLCDYLYELVYKRMAAGTIRYIIFSNKVKEDKFVGMFPISNISRETGLIEPDGGCKTYELIDWVMQENVEKLYRLNGYVGLADAAKTSMSKGDCLRKMYEKNLDAIPLVHEDHLFGIIERTRLLDSVMMDIVIRSKK